MSHCCLCLLQTSEARSIQIIWPKADIQAWNLAKPLQSREAGAARRCIRMFMSPSPDATPALRLRRASATAVAAVRTPKHLHVNPPSATGPQPAM